VLREGLQRKAHSPFSGRGLEAESLTRRGTPKPSFSLLATRLKFQNLKLNPPVQTSGDLCAVVGYGLCAAVSLTRNTFNFFYKDLSAKISGRLP